MALKPHLTFFCELEAQALQSLFADPQLIPNLQALDAGVSLALLDFWDGLLKIHRNHDAADHSAAS